MNSLSLNPGIKRVSSVVRLGYSEEDAILFDQYIVTDRSDRLAAHLDIMNADGHLAEVLVKLLQRAISTKSLGCIEILLSRVTTLRDTEDVYDRNIFHKYIINFGRSRTTPARSTPDSTSTDEGFFITPAVTSRASSPVHLGCSRKTEERLDDIEILRILLKRTPVTVRSSLVAKDFYGRMPLHYGASYGIYKACELIVYYMKEWKLVTEPLRWDTRVWQDTEGLTPLHLAVMNGHEITLNTLFDSEQSDQFPSIIRPTEGQPILSLAVKGNAPELVDRLIVAGMDLNFQDSTGETALHLACRLGYTNVVRRFLAGSETQNCNLELAERTFGWTPLFVAAAEGFTEIVNTLVEGGADPEKCDNSGWYAYEHAFFRGHLECGKRIFPRGPSDGSASFPFTGSPDSLPQLPTVNWKSDNRLEAVKSFGHHSLVGKSMIVVTLGSTDVRKQTSMEPIALDTVPITKAIPTHLDSALSLIVTAKGAEGERYVFDLPFQESPATEPLVFYSANPENVQLLFDIVPTYAGNRDKIVGRAVALLSSVRTQVGHVRTSLQGGVTLPFIESSTLSVIGTISFEFITIHPFTHEKVSIGHNSSYWKTLITSRVIGHRGLGKNENGRKSLQLGENTIASFLAAANLGASYVEMDVQLTKDHIPVVYHDFTVGETGLDAPMHSLTLEQVVLFEWCSL